MQTQTHPDPASAAVRPAAGGLPATHEINPSLRPAMRRVAQPDFRAALAAAFDRLGVSVATPASFERSKAFFRSGGCDWTTVLS